MADTRERCGAPRKTDGRPCTVDTSRRRCPYHSKVRDSRERRVSKPEPAESAAPLAPGRDLRALAWEVIDGLRTGDADTRQAQAIIAAARLLVAIGPSATDSDEVLARTVLRGKVMHGTPPSTPEEWALAATIFNDEALAEFHRWESLEADDRDRIE